MKVFEYLKEPWKAIVAFDMHIASIIPDELYLKSYCRAVSGQKLNLKHPVTYCEKLNWLKLHDKNPMYGQMVDKLAVRDYISSKYGSEFLVPLLAVYDKAEDIDFNNLPEKFVLKCTHDSGSVVICQKKEQMNEEQIRKKLNDALRYDFGRKSRETAYSYIKRRKIIAEEYIYGDEDISDKPDFKFFCFDGKVKMFQVNIGRTTDSGTKTDFFDRDKKPMDIMEADGHGQSGILSLPSSIDRMIELAERFSEGIPHVRVDFLTKDAEIYFSEFTFYHCGGFYPFSPDKWNTIVGNWINLPMK